MRNLKNYALLALFAIPLIPTSQDIRLRSCNQVSKIQNDKYVSDSLKTSIENLELGF